MRSTTYQEIVEIDSVIHEKIHLKLSHFSDFRDHLPDAGQALRLETL